MIHRICLLVSMIAFCFVCRAEGRPFRPGFIPNGTVNRCANCHINPAGGGPRNAFGQAVEARVTPGGREQFWGPDLAKLDSDGDGFTNGQELGDPDGTWKSGDPAPGDPTEVSLPGDPASKPELLEEAKSKLTIQFSNMNPHLGQKLEVRVVDLSTMQEVGRTTVDAIASPDFDVVLDVLEAGYSYRVDFYADLNKNGVYDAPPADHAWRMETGNVTGDTTLNFVHNTHFTDIAWPYLLTLNLTNMNPHLGQKFEVRVVDEKDGMEVGRAKVDTIATPAFSVRIPGLQRGHSYRVDSYADLNKNGVYDAPPADHAWRIETGNVTGDTTLNFVHNTNFTDVDWPYLFTLNLTNMNPHLGQLFELRVVDQNTEKEVGRMRVDSIAVPAFSVSVPGLRKGGSYRVDSYADLNKNGHYDAPPADHAWRQTFTADGDVTLNFVHNTQFTDVMWPAESGGPSEVPEDLKNVTVAVVTLTRDGSPVSGAQVAFSRSVAGLGTDYKWQGTTDDSGHVEVEIEVDAQHYFRTGASGYYIARASDASGQVIGRWNSIPLNGGQEMALWLPIGGRAQVTGSEPINPDEYAGKSAVEKRPTLYVNAPNPFNPSTEITYDLAKAGDVNLVIYSVMGQEVRRLVQAFQPAGTYRVRWDGMDNVGRKVASGIYFYRLQAGAFVATRQMTFLK